LQFSWDLRTAKIRDAITEKLKGMEDVQRRGRGRKKGVSKPSLKIMLTPLTMFFR